MKRIQSILFFLLFSMLAVQAAAPLRGADRLRQLVVFPEMNLDFSLGLVFQGDGWYVEDTANPPDIKNEAQEALKQRPDDVRQLLRLGFASEGAGQTNDAFTSFKQVTKLCQARLETDPADGLNLVYYGYALVQLNQMDQAEAMFRRAVKASPDDWKCWVGLGNFLWGQYQVAIFDDYHRGLPAAAGSGAIKDYRPSAKIVARLKALDEEATRCFEKSVKLTPNDPDVFVQRAGFESSMSYDRNLLDHVLNDRKIDLLLRYSNGLTAPGAITNLQRAAELTTVNPSYVEMAIFVRVIPEIASANSAGGMSMDVEHSRPELWPAATRHFVQESEARLEKMAHSSDSKIAGSAMEGLGLAEMLLGNSDASTANFYKAVSLDPAREGAWDLLLGNLASAHSENGVAVCQQRLAARDSARNCLLLARAYQRQQQWDRVITLTQAALKLDPDDFAAHLELMAVALSQSADTNFISAFGEQYTAMQKLTQGRTASGAEMRYWRADMLDTAIANGLIGTPDCQSTARACLDAVLKYFPGDADAKAIGDALD